MKKAFTAAETIMVLVVLGILAVIAIYNLAPSKSFNSKRILAMSQNFYSTAEGIFQQVLFKHAKGDITKIKDSNDDKKIDSVDLKNHFSKYYVANDIDCASIKLNSASLDGYLEDASCIEVEPHTKVGFYLDTTCKKNSVAYEYLNKDDDILRNVENSCGYIIYAFRGASGILGEDTFVIPFEKRKFF